MNEHDDKLLKLMLKQLISFEQKKIALYLLIINLESSLHAMKNVTPEWEEKFLNEFSILESFNAELPDMNEDVIEKLISNSVTNLKKLIEEEF